MQDAARKLIDRQQQLASDRAVHESRWQEIAEVMAPNRADFNRQRTDGESRTDRIYDDTAGMAANALAAGLWGSIINPATDWFELRHQDDEINELQPVKLWCEQATRQVRNAFAANGLKFYAAAKELFDDLIPFGTGVFYIDEMVGQGGLFFACRPLSESYVAENQWGQVDAIYRRFLYTARQAEQKWGRDKLSTNIVRALDREPNRRFPFIHAVLPREEYDGEKGISRAHRWASVYLDVEGKSILSQGGYHEFPFMVPRWNRGTPSVYGEGPGLQALPHVLTLQAMKRDVLIAAEMANDPPWLAGNEEVFAGLRKTPGSVVYGAVNEQGNALIQAMRHQGEFPIGLELIQHEQESVKETFFHSLMLMLQQPNMTATEVIARQEEKLRLLGPHVGRIQSEFLDAAIDRVFPVMYRAGAFPPPPDILLEAPALRIEYVSPMARAMRSSQAQAIMQTAGFAAQFAEAFPGMRDNFDEDKIIRAFGDSTGMQVGLFKDPRQVDQERQARQQAQMAQMAAGAAEPMSAAVKNIAQAGQAMRAAPANAA